MTALVEVAGHLPDDAVPDRTALAGVGPADLVLRGRRVLVDGELVPATVVVRGGRIAEILPAHAVVDAAADHHLAGDELLLPGMVDTHVHVNEPGRTPWEGFASATAAAAAGGVTTILDMPLNSIPATTTTDALEVKRAVARPKVQVDTGFWGGAVPQNLGSLGDLHDAGVFGFKAFLAPSGVPEFDHLDRAQLDRALAEVAELDALLLVHAEDPTVLDAHAGVGGVRYADFVSSRPESAEITAIDGLVAGLRAQRRSGREARAHILHLSSAGALPLIREARADGLRLTVETCPHYLVFAAEAVPDGATTFKCCPPIRDSRNQDLLWAALEDGTIDMVVSDHSPSTRELKVHPAGDFALAWGGIAGLQVGFTATAAAARERGIGVEQVARWMSTRPAEIVGLTGKGGIRVGADADLAVYAPGEAWRVDAATLAHKNPVSAYDGLSVTGKVRTTWLRGTMVGGGPDGGSPAGRLLSR